MPFIRGHYHINPIAGAALEAAREAEEALAEREAQDQSDGFAYEDDAAKNSAHSGGPVHRVEIEAAELVPSHSGRASRGFVARVHRHPSGSGHEGAPGANGGADMSGHLPPAGRSETHIFSSHRDLLNFLNDTFQHGCAKSAY
jgi:hypothetical protein